MPSLDQGWHDARLANQLPRVRSVLHSWLTDYADHEFFDEFQLTGGWLREFAHAQRRSIGGVVVSKSGKILSPSFFRLNPLGQSPLNELAIEGGVGFLPRRFEVLPGASEVAGATVEFAERGVEQVIMTQGRVVAGFVQRPNPRVRTFNLSHDDRAIEQINQ